MKKETRMAVKRTLNTNLDAPLKDGFVWYENNATALVTHEGNNVHLRLLLPNELLERYPWYSASFNGFIECVDSEHYLIDEGCSLNDIIKVWQMRAFKRPCDIEAFNRVKRVLEELFTIGIAGQEGVADDPVTIKYSYTKYEVRKFSIFGDDVTFSVSGTEERYMVYHEFVDLCKKYNITKAFRVKAISLRGWYEYHGISDRRIGFKRRATRGSGVWDKYQVWDRAYSTNLLSIEPHHTERVGAVVELCDINEEGLTPFHSYVLDCSEYANRYIDEGEALTLKISDSSATINTIELAFSSGRVILPTDLFFIANDFCRPLKNNPTLEETKAKLQESATLSIEGVVDTEEASRLLQLTNTIQNGRVSGRFYPSPVKGILVDGDDIEATIVRLMKDTATPHLSQYPLRDLRDAMVECFNRDSKRFGANPPRFASYWPKSANRLEELNPVC